MKLKKGRSILEPRKKGTLRPDPRKIRSKTRWLIFYIVVSLVGAYFMSLISKFWAVVILAVMAIVILTLVGLKIRKWYTQRSLMVDFSKVLRDGLERIDKTAKYYRDEDEANKELTLYLQSRGYDAQYQYKYKNRTADIRVNDVLIEGKLSPDQSEVDRLIGQLRAYSTLPFKTFVVIYGQVDHNVRQDIEKEISSQYNGRIFLVTKNNPTRLKSVSAKNNI